MDDDGAANIADHCKPAEAALTVRLGLCDALKASHDVRIDKRPEAWLLLCVENTWEGEPLKSFAEVHDSRREDDQRNQLGDRDLEVEAGHVQRLPTDNDLLQRVAYSKHHARERKNQPTVEEV